MRWSSLTRLCVCDLPILAGDHDIPFLVENQYHGNHDDENELKAVLNTVEVPNWMVCYYYQAKFIVQ